MPTQRVQFNEWLPDQPDNAGGLNDALNVIPVSIGYQPFPNAVDFSGAAAEDINSVFVAKWGTEIVIFAGGATKLFKFNSAKTFSNQSAILSILSKHGPSEFPCPGKSIDKTLKFLFEKNCSVRDQTICVKPLPCRNTMVSLELSMPCPASEA